MRSTKPLLAEGPSPEPTLLRRDLQRKARMSHRIATKTTINDKDLAISALRAKGWQYSVKGNTISVLSGPLNRAHINLDSGEIEGDTDFHGWKGDSLLALNQAYAEAAVRQQVALKGGYVESTETLEDGTLRIVASVTLA